MKAVFFFILVSTLLVLPCAAEEISFEILQNSNDEYYISYEDNLISCANDTCTFDVSNYTTNTTELELSRDDMKKIAQYVALEIEIPAYTGSVNESFITNSNIELRNEILDSFYARTQNTFVPSLEEINACETNLTASQNMIVDLKAKAGEYDNMKELKNTEISTLKESKDTFKWIAILASIGMFCVAGANSSAFKRMLELKRRKQ